jgi:hypothetical protein
MRTFLSIAIPLAAAFALGTSGAWAQQKQKVTYKIGAENTKYPQRHTLEAGDQPGHTLSLYEIHRVFGANAPVVNGLKLKETWSRGYGDFVNFNGLTVNYQTFIAENGDRFFASSRTMGHADAGGKRTTMSVGEITGGTGKFAGMRGMTRAQGASDGKRGFNETSAEIEYWFLSH